METINRVVAWLWEKYVWHNEYYHRQFNKYRRLAWVVLFGGVFLLIVIDAVSFFVFKYDFASEFYLMYVTFAVGMAIGYSEAYHQIDKHDKKNEDAR